MTLFQAFDGWLKEMTGLKEIPYPAEEDAQALKVIMNELVSAFSDNSFHYEHTPSSMSGSGTITVSISSEEFEKELDTGITAVLTKQKDVLDPLLDKYSDVLQLISPQIPATSEMLLIYWKAFVSLLPEHNYTVQFTLDYAVDSWAIKGHAIDWQFDVSWREGRFLAQLDPGMPLPEDTASIVIDSNDLARLKAFAHEVLQGISPYAFRFETNASGFQMLIDPDVLYGEMITSICRSASKHDLKPLEERYSYLLQPIRKIVNLIGAPFYSFDNALIDLSCQLTYLLTSYLPQVRLDCRYMTDRNWCVDLMIGNIQLYVCGGPEGFSARLTSGEITIPLDISWTNTSFTATLQLPYGYGISYLTIAGSQSGEQFTVNAFATDYYSESVFDLKLTGDLHHATLSGTVDDDAISGEFDYSPRQAACKVYINRDLVVKGTATRQPGQFSLSLNIDGFPVHILLIGSIMDDFVLQFGLGEWKMEAKFIKYAPDQVEISVAAPAVSMEIHTDASSKRLKLTMTNPRYWRYRRNIQKDDTILLSLAADSFEAAYTRYDGLKYAVSYWPGTLQIIADRFCYTVEDFTPYTSDCLNATRITEWLFMGIRRMPVVNSMIMLTTQEKNRAFVFRAYNKMDDDELLLGQVTLDFNPVYIDGNLPKIEPIKELRWVDYQWVKEYLAQLLALPGQQDSDGSDASNKTASAAVADSASAMPANTLKMTGTAKGFQSDVTVNVTVVDGVITSIKIDSSGETAGFGTCCGEDEAFLNQFLGKKVPVDGEFDALTGATITSQTVIEAINNAWNTAEE